MCRTPDSLIDYVKNAESVIYLPDTEQNDRILESETRLMRKRRPAYLYFKNFIMNFIPSDYYLYRKSRLDKDGVGRDRELHEGPSRKLVEEEEKGMIDDFAMMEDS